MESLPRELASALGMSLIRTTQEAVVEGHIAGKQKSVSANAFKLPENIVTESK